MSGRGKLDSIGYKVVDDLFYSIHIALDYCIGSYEFMLKEQALIIDGLCGTVHHTVQQIRYAEWYRMHSLFGLVESIDIKQVVHKVQDMLATAKYLFQLLVAFLFVTSIHCQLTITDDAVERTAYVV